MEQRLEALEKAFYEFSRPRTHSEMMDMSCTVQGPETEFPLINKGSHGAWLLDFAGDKAKKPQINIKFKEDYQREPHNMRNYLEQRYQEDETAWEENLDALFGTDF